MNKMKSCLVGILVATVITNFCFAQCTTCDYTSEPGFSTRCVARVTVIDRTACDLSVYGQCLYTGYSPAQTVGICGVTYTGMDVWCQVTVTVTRTVWKCFNFCAPTNGVISCDCDLPRWISSGDMNTARGDYAYNNTCG